MAERILRHIVMYRFRPELPEGAVAEVERAFAGLARELDLVRDFEWGTNVSPEGKSQGFTHCFCMGFADEAARDEYLVHPAHQRFVELVSQRREAALVLDYWAEGAPGA